MRLYLQRHGSTELNEKNALRGWMNVPLSELGQKQAAIAADYFERIPLTRIFTSDLDRASNTALEIAKRHPTVELGWTPKLRPINFGDLQGIAYDNIEAQLAPLFRDWQRDPSILSPGGESFTDFQDRLYAFLNNVCATYAGTKEEILLVTHTRVCSYAAALCYSGARPLIGPDLRFMDGLEVACGNCIVLEDFKPLRIVGLNNIRQIES